VLVHGGNHFDLFAHFRFEEFFDLYGIVGVGGDGYVGLV